MPIPGDIRLPEQHLEVIDAVGADVPERGKMSEAKRSEGGSEERIEVGDGLEVLGSSQDIKGYALDGTVTVGHRNSNQQRVAFGLVVIAAADRRSRVERARVYTRGVVACEGERQTP